MKLKNLDMKPTVLLAELVGTFILATVAITVANPIIVGFTLVALVLAIGAVSGAHMNPAITLGLWSVRKIEALKVPFYWAMQFAGAMLALLVAQLFQGNGYALSFASFTSLDGKVFLAEVIGMAVFAFAVAAAFERKELDSAKAFVVGLGLLAGIAVGSGLLGQAIQNATADQDGNIPRVAKIDGAVLNPAIALSASEKAEQQSLQSLQGGAPEKKTPASRLTLETLLGALVGSVIGMQIFMVTIGVNPFKKREKLAEKVTTVIKKGGKEIKKEATKVTKKAKAKSKK